jgi:regulator of RNase E activity RraA
VSASSLVDAMGARHSHPFYIRELVTPSPGRVLFGPACTISFLPARDDRDEAVANDFARLFYLAVGTAPEGAVLVMGGGGHPDAALAGARKMSRAAFGGLAGVLADGRIRDLGDLGEMGLAIYCNGETARQRNRVTPVAADVAVQVRGVTIVPGDYIYADAAGAVVIPAPSLTEVMRAAVAMEERDTASIAASRDEDPHEVARYGSPRPGSPAP